MKVFIRLLKYIKPYWWRVVISAIAATCVGTTDGGAAYLIGPVLKRMETGRHDALLARGGVYKKLYDIQFKS